MNKSISIIIPAFNVEKFITKTLISLEKQIFNNFEVLIINDGSTDKTYDVVNQFIISSKLSLKIITQENRGVSEARNNGLVRASGEYIVFLDGDDYVENNYTHLLYNSIVKESECDTVFCRYQKVDTKGSVIDNYIRFLKYPEIYDNKQMLKLFLNDSEIIWTGAIMYKRDLLMMNNIKFSKGVAYCEDQEFFFKAIFYSKKILFVKQVLAYYLQRPGSAVNNINPKKIRSDIFVYNRLKNFIKNKDEDLCNLLITNKIPKQIVNVLFILLEKEYYNDFFRLSNKQVIKKHLKFLIFNYDIKIILRMKIILLILSPNLFFKLHYYRKKNRIK